MSEISVFGEDRRCRCGTEKSPSYTVRQFCKLVISVTALPGNPTPNLLQEGNLVFEQEPRVNGEDKVKAKLCCQSVEKAMEMVKPKVTEMLARLG